MKQSIMEQNVNSNCFWHSISESLPDEDTEVLIWERYKTHVHVALFIGRVFVYRDIPLDTTDVVAWAYIPEYNPKIDTNMKERNIEKNSKKTNNACRILSTPISECAECCYFRTYHNVDFPSLYTGICKYNNNIVVSDVVAEHISETGIPDWCHLEKADDVVSSELKVGDLGRIGISPQVYMYLGTRNDSHCFICVEGEMGLIPWPKDVCRKYRVPVGTIPTYSTKNFTKIDNPY